MLAHASNNPGVVLHRKVDVSYFSAVNAPVQTCSNARGARQSVPRAGIQNDLSIDWDADIRRFFYRLIKIAQTNQAV